MQIYDLDIDDNIDIIKIGTREYEIGDIPIWIYERIQKISLNFTTDNKLFKQWREIIIELLEIKNENVDISKLGEKHILKMINIISNKIKEQDDYKK